MIYAKIIQTCKENFCIKYIFSITTYIEKFYNNLLTSNAFNGIILTVIYMKINTEELGKRIAKRRKSQKIKQEELANILDISYNHLSSIERGRAVPSMALFCEICDALSVTPDYLLLGDMHSNNVPKDIMDLLRLCTDEQITFVQKFVQLVVESRFEEKTGDK